MRMSQAQGALLWEKKNEGTGLALSPMKILLLFTGQRIREGKSHEMAYGFVGNL